MRLVIDGAPVLHACTGPHTVVVMAGDLQRVPVRGTENTRGFSRAHARPAVRARALAIRSTCADEKQTRVSLCVTLAGVKTM